MSKQAEALLKAAGWTSSRCVGITKYQEALSIEGYRLFSAWEQAMTQFGGLLVSYRVPRSPSRTATVHFDPIRAASKIFREVVESYERRVGEPLAVIGAADNEHLTLLIGPSGKVYGGYDEFLGEFGSGVIDALDCLLSKRAAREIEE